MQCPAIGGSYSEQSAGLFLPPAVRVILAPGAGRRPVLRLRLRALVQVCALTRQLGTQRSALWDWEMLLSAIQTLGGGVRESRGTI